jgi:hypothetical protein
VRKWLAVAALAAGLLTPLAVQAAGGPAECARLRRQIDHFQRMTDRAEELGDPMWTERMGQHLALMKGRQKNRCPHDVPTDDSTARAFMQLLRVAGEAAVSYFTFGAM